MLSSGFDARGLPASQRAGCPSRESIIGPLLVELVVFLNKAKIQTRDQINQPLSAVLGSTLSLDINSSKLVLSVSSSLKRCSASWINLSIKSE